MTRWLESSETELFNRWESFQRCLTNLSNVEAGEVLIEDISLYQKVEKISSTHVFQYLSFRVEMKSK
jgi:hypothetical protein